MPDVSKIDTEKEKKIKTKALDLVRKVLDKNNVEYSMSDKEIEKWLNNEPTPVGGYDLFIGSKETMKACKLINSVVNSLGFRAHMDNYHTIWLSYKFGAKIDECLSMDNESILNECIYYNDDLFNLIEQAEYSEKNKYPIYIVLQYSNSGFSEIIKTITGDEYTHACISFNEKLNPLYSFGKKSVGVFNHGLVVQNGPDHEFYKTHHVTYSVYVLFVDKSKYNKIKENINNIVSNANKYSYDFSGLFDIITGTPSEKNNKFFCSAFVSKMLDSIKVLNGLRPHYSLYRADDLKDLNNISLLVKGDEFRKYDYKDTLKVLEHIKNHEYDKYIDYTKKKNNGSSSNMIKEQDLLDLVGDYGTFINEDTKTKTVISTKPTEEDKPTIQELMDNTNHKHIYLTSDWHFFKNHYKHEANYVNTQKILTWCRQNIKPDDVFIYLGDLSFRYANDEDNNKVKQYMASIPGHKVFVIGNHDKMLGQDFFTECGFDYVLEDFQWDKYIFTHRPLNMDTHPNDWYNIHGHIHNIRKYNTTDGKRNINVYPMFYDNKPVTLYYIEHHLEELVKDNEWNFNAGYGESKLYINSLSVKDVLTEQDDFVLSREISKPVVYFSNEINAKTIAYMAYLFKDKIGSRTAIKLHFGEDGNKNFLSPRYLKELVRITNGALVDSNTAYDGSTRGDTANHIKTATKHGFNFGFIDILDADGSISVGIPSRYKIERDVNDITTRKKKAYEVVPSIGDHLKEIKLGSHIKNYDSLIVYTHFKGHSIAGYGGSLKNIGMGVPSKEGKLQIHGTDFNTTGGLFLERLVESAEAVSSMFKDKIIYINVLKNISTKCDCEKDAPRATIPDIGVLVSDDLVAIEQASLDFIRNTPKNRDILEQIATIGGFHQIEYMKYLGMGSSDYKLRTLNGETIKLEHSNTYGGYLL